MYGSRCKICATLNLGTAQSLRQVNYHKTNSPLFRVQAKCSENTISVPARSTPMNDRIDDTRRVATAIVPRSQTYAASAIAAPAKVRKVRIFSVQLERSEGPVNDFCSIYGCRPNQRTPVSLTLVSSNPGRRTRQERDKSAWRLHLV